ncbi:hypothetical protein J2Y46_002603 [Microbacterium sp. BE35]|uniref:hypothetical protein n=1 Tax=Microbacterium sp. BE35 TaxID=2817773 RepID=UPI00285B5FF6|nr:hypothetical protein [Microbacterium sp. BE35]MDR7189777.1 hypothetical protein [Microbacterium sp. BE35]
MEAFATVAELETRLGRTFEVDQQEQIQVLLEDASTYLRHVIGQVVYPRVQSTFVGYPVDGRLDLPQWPIVSVDEVTRDGAGVEHRYRPGYITVVCDEPVTVKFTWGFLDPPEELVRYTCVLVSQALLTIEANLGLSAGGLSSVSIDDFKIAWADAGGLSGMALTPHAEAAVRNQFGMGSATIAGSR